MTPVLNPSTVTVSSQTPVHVPARQVRKGPLIAAVQVPRVGEGAGGGGGGALGWQEQFQVPPTPGPPAILATVTEPCRGDFRYGLTRVRVAGAFRKAFAQARGPCQGLSLKSYMRAWHEIRIVSQ